MSPYLSRRLAKAFYRGRASMAEADLLVAAAGPPGVRSIDDLPPSAAALLRDLVTRETALKWPQIGQWR
jgi:hypothetical protein